MTLQELQNQVLQLSLSDRWYLVQSLLASIQKETVFSHSAIELEEKVIALEPWTKSFIGVIELSEDKETLTEAYTDCLEEKYR